APLAFSRGDVGVGELVAAWARRAPNSTALEVPGAAPWRAATLSRRVASAATELKALLAEADDVWRGASGGLEPQDGSCVALGVDEGPGRVALELAILAAGSFFLPVDLQYPVSRIRLMLNLAAARILVAPDAWIQGPKARSLRDEGDGDSPALSDALQSVSAEVLLGLASSDSRNSAAAFSTSAKAPQHSWPRAPRNSLAYIQFTSGSTGRPKGVLCEHRHAAWYARSKAAAEGIGPGCRVLVTAAFTFDPCQGDSFCALSAGAMLCVAPRVRLLQDLAAVIRETSTSHVCATPALWRLVDAAPSAVPSLRLLSLGGEAMPEAVIALWASEAVELRNVYGVTEATVYQTWMHMGFGGASSRSCAGRPFPGASVAVRPFQGDEDSANEDSTIGEVCLAGPGIARGYLRQPELTAGRFQSEAGVPCYRTGDCGRWRVAADVAGRPARLLDLLGRRDFQVKLNGERIELGEVEGVLSQSPLVSTCVVAVDCSAAVLFAYVVLANGEPELDWVATLALELHCANLLPRAMRPRRFVPLQSMPLTTNGKVDRTALPSLSDWLDETGSSSPASAVAPLANALEAAVALAWSTELGLSAAATGAIGRHANFYQLGGGSVQAVRITRVLRSVLHGGGGGKPRWAEGASNWRDPAGDAALFLPPQRAGDAECHFGLCEGGPFAPCQLLERPLLREYAAFLSSSGVRDTPDLPAAATELDDPVMEQRQQEQQEQQEQHPEEQQPDQLELEPQQEHQQQQQQQQQQQHQQQQEEQQQEELQSAGSMTSGTGPAQLAKALEVAVRGGRTAALRALLKLGASANGGLEARQPGVLVAHGARVLAATGAGAVPAHLAAAAGHPEALEALLELGTPARVRDGSRQGLAHFAARAGSQRALRVALEWSAEVDARDKQHRTALHWAALEGDKDIASLLLDARANPNPPVASLAAHRRATRLPRETPLDLALRSSGAGRLELLAILLQAGCEGLEPDARSRSSHQT
ncbi:unnamed protein product, partial [Polarella glacialis]